MLYTTQERQLIRLFRIHGDVKDSVTDEMLVKLLREYKGKISDVRDVIAYVKEKTSELEA